MEVIWETPKNGYAKINVHYVSVDEPLANGNTNSVAALIRNDKGKDLWKAFGPLTGRTEEQAILTAIQAACIEALKQDLDISHIETENHQVYETIRFQEEIFLDDDQLEFYGMFNTIHVNNFKAGSTQRKIACIPPHMNSAAQYLSSYGLNNVKVFTETTKMVGDLHFYLERDMGRTLPLPFLDLIPDLGNGEVEDASPPRPSKRQKLGTSSEMQGVRIIEPCVVPSVAAAPANHAGPSTSLSLARVDKGKAKILDDSGTHVRVPLSSQAIRLLEDKSLATASKVCTKDVVDLNASVGNGLLARDVLRHALSDTMHEIAPVVVPAMDPDFMTIEQVLLLMGYGV